MRTHHRPAARIAWLTILTLAGGCARAPVPPRDDRRPMTFKIIEQFGVHHPDQIMEFDWPAGRATNAITVLNGNRQPVPFQFLDGGKRLAVRTDLPAGATQAWTIVSQPAASAETVANAVTIHETEAGYEIANGLTGVRLPQPQSWRTNNVPVPIQGIRLRDGSWTATGLNTFNPVVAYWPANELVLKNLGVRFLERGPLRVVVALSYLFALPNGGDGHYTSTVKLEAGQPSVLFEEDADIDLAYSLDLSAGMHPTRAQYRGHRASTLELGRNPDGTIYSGWYVDKQGRHRPAAATLDLNYQGYRPLPVLAVWNPWVFDMGWWWQAFDAAGPAQANVVGIFAGPASRSIYPHASGVAPLTDARGVTDLVSVRDAAGGLHAVYQHGREVAYVAFDANLKPDHPVTVFARAQNPDLLVQADGRVSVVAYDALARQFRYAERQADGSFAPTALPLAAPEQVVLDAPFAYQASHATAQFILLYGRQAGGEPGFLLFARPKGAATFSYADIIPRGADYATMWGQSEQWQPTFVRQPEGSLELYFTDRNGFPQKAVIAAGATRWQRTDDQIAAETTRGVAGDERTGDVIIVGAGKLYQWSPGAKVGTIAPIALFSGNSFKGPNRRTLAVAPTGDALAVHWDRERMQSVADTAHGYRSALAFVARSNGTWSACPALNDLQFATARVHYDAGRRQFLILGSREGQLTLYSWTPGGPPPAQLCQLPETARPTFGLTISRYRLASNGMTSDRSRFSWGLFVGVKGEDVQDPEQVPPIGRQMNLHSGVNLGKFARWDMDFPDPKRGYGSLYMPAAVLDRMKNRLRAEATTNTTATARPYYNYLVRAEPYSRELVDLWADADGSKLRAVLDDMSKFISARVNDLVNGDGIYAQWNYWQFGLASMHYGLLINQLLGDPRLTPTERARVKASAVFYANVLWDNDFVPMENYWGLNMGTPNMPVQQIGYRSFYALLLAEHPTMRARAATVAQSALGMFRTVVNEHGAGMGSLHYMQPAVVPNLMNLLISKQSGVLDAFRSDDRLPKFAEFYLQGMTPPEPRFGGKRKLVAIGDGSTEGSEIYGMLATGFRDASPALSARLQGAWVANGKPHSSFFGSTLLMIDEEAPVADPALGSAAFPGYFSVLRSGWGTPAENAIWCVNGNFYVDHPHHDLGEVIIYALGAPLAVDWGSIYTPRTAGGVMHSTVIQESAFGQPWDKDLTSVGIGAGFSAHWGNVGVGEATALDTFPEGQRLVATVRCGAGSNETTWVRAVTMVHADPAHPVIVIHDTFSGHDATAPKIWTMNLMAAGPVETPAGPQTPPLRTHPQSAEPTDRATQTPSAGPVFALAPGVNRLGFTGQTWKGYPSGGIDWDVYLISPEPQQAQIGNWANLSGANGGEFAEAQGRPFEERQHILRVRSAGAFTTVIVPWRKGDRPAGLQVRQTGDQITVASDRFQALIGPHSYAVTIDGRKVERSWK